MGARRLLFGAICALLFCASAAQAQITVGQSYQAVTITGTAAIVIPVNPTLKYSVAEIYNQGTGGTAGTIKCIWNGTASTTDTAGQFTFLPSGGGFTWDINTPPPAGQALNCICTTSSCPATARAF
jgi:hypothetical protein